MLSHNPVFVGESSPQQDTHPTKGRNSREKEVERQSMPHILPTMLWKRQSHTHISFGLCGGSHSHISSQIINK